MAHDIFIKIDGIRGESMDAQHPDEIIVNEWHWDITGSSVDDVTHQQRNNDLVFTHNVDRASPALAKHCRIRQRVPKAVLTMRYAGGTPREFLRLTMLDVLVNRVSPSGASHYASEIVHLSFARVNHEYVMRSQDGNQTGAAIAMLDMMRRLS